MLTSCVHLSKGHCLGAINQKIRQYFVKGLCGHDLAIITIAFVAAFLKSRLKLPELIEIGIAYHCWLGDHAEAALQICKTNVAVKIKIYFLTIEHMEQGDIMFLKSQVLKSTHQGFDICKTIRENDHQCSSFGFFRKFVKCLGQSGLTFAFDLIE